MTTKKQLRVLWPTTQNGKIIQWLVRPRDRIRKGDRLAICDPYTLVLESPVDGVVTNTCIPTDSEVLPRTVIAHILPSVPTSKSKSVPIVPIVSTPNVTLAELHERLLQESLSKSKITTLIESRRLALILDLDLTILHSVVCDRLAPGTSLDRLQDVFQFEIEGGLQYVVKFRPGLVGFLMRTCELFEIHVYTMGTREYAKAVLDTISNKMVGGKQVIDGKVLTRCDTGNYNNKSISSILPGMESMALILDDHVNIWEKSNDNLIPIYPYKFFRSIKEPHVSTEISTPSQESPLVQQPKQHNQNYLPGQKKRQEGASNSRQRSLKMPYLAPDTHLQSMYQVLEDVHRQYFTYLHKTTDVTEHLRWRRQWVLSGVHVVFSGVFALGTLPEEQILWKQAIIFGAKCHKHMNPSITHLVAAREGTDKVLEAVQRGGVFMVTPNWLCDSIAHWVRLDEKHFNLGNFPACIGDPPKIPQLSSEYPYSI